MTDPLPDRPSVSAAELNRRFGEIRRNLFDGAVTITHHGTPTMVLLAIDHYRKMSLNDAAPDLASAWRRKLQIVLDHIREGYFSIDSDFRVQTINRVAELFVGRTRDELVGLDFQEAFPAISGELEGMRQVMETGEVRRFQRHSLLHPDRMVAVTMIPLPLPTGGVGVFFDNITEQTRMQAAFNERESAINGLLEAIDDRILFTTNSRQRIETWGRGAERLLGWTNGQMQYQPLDALVVSRQSSAESGAARLELRHADGSTRSARGTTTALAKDSPAQLFVLSLES